MQLYEAYAYECYLTNEIKEAIIYTDKLLHILKKKQQIERTGNCLRFLSRLWWLDGSRKNAKFLQSKRLIYYITSPHHLQKQWHSAICRN
jgi:hypothetical protein